MAYAAWHQHATLSSTTRHSTTAPMLAPPAPPPISPAIQSSIAPDVQLNAPKNWRLHNTLTIAVMLCFSAQQSLACWFMYFLCRPKQTKTSPWKRRLSVRVENVLYCAYLTRPMASPQSSLRQTPKVTTAVLLGQYSARRNLAVEVLSWRCRVEK